VRNRPLSSADVPWRLPASAPIPPEAGDRPPADPPDGGPERHTVAARFMARVRRFVPRPPTGYRKKRGSRFAPRGRRLYTNPRCVA